MARNGHTNGVEAYSAPQLGRREAKNRSGMIFPTLQFLRRLMSYSSCIFELQQNDVAPTMLSMAGVENSFIGAGGEETPIRSSELIDGGI